MSFAKIVAVGNLTRDPETRYTPNGAMNVQFTIAADGRKRGENTTFLRVTAWDRLAERLVGLQEKGYLGKGSALYVEGQLETRSYEKDGQARTSLDATLTDFQFVVGGSRNDTERAGNARDQFRAAGYAPDAGSEDLNDLPF